MAAADERGDNVPTQQQQQQQSHLQIMKELPNVISEPYIYLSELQREVVQRYPLISSLGRDLPGWVPHRLIGAALGFSPEAIDKALQRLEGVPYVWATEFENVHSLWRFHEPSVNIDEKIYPCSESYYHSQKPTDRPFDSASWEARRVDVMKRAVRAKFLPHRELCQLLLSTSPHPLLSIKPDPFWGFHPNGYGENMLAVLLTELRDEIFSTQRDQS